jgi:hypothetical protein
MKKTRLLFIGVVAGVVLTLAFIFFSPGRRLLAVSANNDRLLASTPTPSLAPGAGDEELPPPSPDGPDIHLNALPTPIPGQSLVYFITSDSDATATVVYLLNTDSVAHTVALRGYSYNGVLGYSLNITVAATSILRLSSDSIAASPPPSWATPAPIITNFTDFTYFASLSLPKGVKVEGYILHNSGTGVVDPRLDQGAVPLHFSSDPASLFLPLASN